MLGERVRSQERRARQGRKRITTYTDTKNLQLKHFPLDAAMFKPKGRYCRVAGCRCPKMKKAALTLSPRTLRRWGAGPGGKLFGASLACFEPCDKRAESRSAVAVACLLGGS